MNLEEKIAELHRQLDDLRKFKALTKNVFRQLPVATVHMLEVSHGVGIVRNIRADLKTAIVICDDAGNYGVVAPGWTRSTNENCPKMYLTMVVGRKRVTFEWRFKSYERMVEVWEAYERIVSEANMCGQIFV